MFVSPDIRPRLVALLDEAADLIAEGAVHHDGEGCAAAIFDIPNACPCGLYQSLYKLDEVKELVLKAKSS